MRHVGIERELPDIKLMRHIADVAQELMNHAENAALCTGDSAVTLNDLSDPDVFLESESADADDRLVRDLIADAARDERRVREELANFDRQLSELIAARGRLAEITGITMFSHIGEEDRFLADRDEYEM